MILRNRARCLKCGDVIESKSVHDFVTCSCGNLSVDGGKYYLKRCFKTSEWEDVSVCKGVLKEYFEDNSINVNAFAKKWGINAQTLYGILNGKSKVGRIGVTNFKKIADGLGMTIDELYKMLESEMRS